MVLILLVFDCWTQEVLVRKKVALINLAEPSFLISKSRTMNEAEFNNGALIL